MIFIELNGKYILRPSFGNTIGGDWFGHYVEQ